MRGLVSRWNSNLVAISFNVYMQVLRLKLDLKNWGRCS
jgi:hypothetical protein